MILIYTDKVTPRLEYVADFIFREQYGLSLKITDLHTEFDAFDGFKIRYAKEHRKGAWFSIPATGLVYEKDIRQLDVVVTEWESCPVLFSGNEGDIPFDIFSAVFFLLSRYEEYWPHEKDMYGRFAHEQAIASRYDFLHLPVVNIWLTSLTRAMQRQYPGLELPRPVFQFKPTYDIDIAWSYQHKGLWRNLGGFLQKPGISRWKVLAGVEQDPYDSYFWLDGLHERYELKPMYFFLVASDRNRYDKNISPDNHAMRVLIEKHAMKYAISLHPSWASHSSRMELSEEKKTLSAIIGKPVTASRQHYIWYRTPETFRELIEAGISDDYSMGYGSINGFRASVASSFLWYDLEREATTPLRLHPFCFMDANAHYEQKQDAATSWLELQRYYEVCQKHHGIMITIFHNQFLGTDPMFAGWKEMYESFISQVRR